MLEFQYILLAALGLSLNGVMRLEKIQLREDDFNWTRWFRGNVFSIIGTVIMTITLLLMAEDIIYFLGVIPPEEAPFWNIHAFMSGYIPHNIFYQLKSNWMAKRLGVSNEK